MDFCKQISSLLKYGHIDLTLHGLYHELDGKIEDFDTESKEQEKQEIQEGLDILSAVNLPRPSMFIPPAWHLSRQCIEALKELNFNMSESMTDIKFTQKGKKYILNPVMNWINKEIKKRINKCCSKTKKCFMADYLMSMVTLMGYIEWLSILLTTLMGHYKTKLK